MVSRIRMIISWEWALCDSGVAVYDDSKKLFFRKWGKLIKTSINTLLDY